MNKTEKIRKLFMKGNKLTNIKALHYAGTFKLPDIVYSLKKRGYVFNTTMKTDADGNPYAEYEMLETPAGRLLL